MKRRSWVIVTIVLALAIALVAVGCGKKKSESAAGMSPTDIMAAAQKADMTTTSAKVVGTITMTIKGDAAKLGQSDPQTKALFNAPITLAIDGSFAKEPLTFDGTVTAKLMGQDLTFGLRTDGTDAWISYKDKWYETPADFKSSLNQIKTEAAKASPSAVQSQLDTTKMGGTSTVVGTEQVAGVEASHISTTFDGPKVLQYMGEQLTTDGALKDGLTSALGAASAAEPSAVPSVDPTQMAVVKDLLAAMTISTFKIDTWHQTSDQRTVKEDMTLSMTFGAMLATYGLEGLDLTGTMTLSNLDQPVTVTAPDPVLPAEQFSKDTAELQKLFPSTSGGGL